MNVINAAIRIFYNHIDLFINRYRLKITVRKMNVLKFFFYRVVKYDKVTIIFNHKMFSPELLYPFKIKDIDFKA